MENTPVLPALLPAMPPYRLLVLALLLAGCDLIERPPLADEFGAPYDIVLGAPASGEGGLPTPAITDDGDLVVVVAYRGGCHDHSFGLRFAIADAAARLWIVHEDFGDACEGLQQEELAFALGPNVLAQPTVELLDPGGAALALRTVDR